MNRPRGSAIVAFGGGHGLHTSLTALRRITDRLTAVVTVADDGGSSGRLRREFGCLPPGDLRMALAALCGDDQVGRRWASVPVAGLDMVGELLRTRGRVLPMSSVPLQIEADVLGLDPLAPDELCTLAGQATVAKTRATVQSVRLIPENPPAHPEAVAAVRQADAIVMGPGSWFTSVIPHLLVPELRDAILSTPARRILVMNIAAADETDGFTASRHIELLAEHAPTLRLDFVLADVGFVGSDRHLTRFAASLGAELAVADIRCHDGSARHDPKRLADAYQELLAS